MTRKTAIALQPALSRRVRVFARRKRTRCTTMCSRALKKLLYDMETRDMMRRLEEVYSEPATAEEQAILDGMFRLYSETVTGKW